MGRPPDGQLQKSHRHCQGKGRQGRNRSVRGPDGSDRRDPQDAAPHDVLTLCARALADVVPNCCEAHQDEFKAEFLRVLSDCVAVRQEQDEAEAGGDDEAHTSVH